MSDGLFHSQDVDLKSCKIVTSAGKPLELKDIVVELNYFEDIFNNGISGRLTTSSFQNFSSSVHSEIIAATNEQSFNGLISGSSQLTSSYDQRYVISGSITQTTWDNIANKPSGIVSGSSQLTSSYDTRYVISGSITQTTWDNIANKPAGIVSGSVQVDITATTGYSTFSASIASQFATIDGGTY